MAQANNKKTAAQALAQLARAWTDLEERKRILRMRPKPKDIDTEALAHRKRKAAFVGALETEEAEQPASTKRKATTKATEKPTTNAGEPSEPTPKESL